ncbi:antizyme inhibitor 2-like [Lethenteron reissneri]|uniref:antizyme inhibitor 2-like n=1 Tax=Lethenteron reissneri TaxID=7753 RepID=UPI002AB71C89|nr:antizyme inhibitor 2-like [Lethenteron reissneri]
MVEDGKKGKREGERGTGENVCNSHVRGVSRHLSELCEIQAQKTWPANERTTTPNIEESELLVFDDDVETEEVLRSLSKGEYADEKDAFYVVDLGDIVRKHLRWLGALPRVWPFYAVKCNNTQTIVHTLATLGTGFDCASKAEIALVQSLGVSADRIIYANPCKQASHVRYAAEHGVNLMTFDNDAELHKVARVNPNARLVLRIATDDSKSMYKLSRKFGASVESSHQLLETAQGLGLLVVGVSFHVGSCCQDVVTYTEAIANARQVFNNAAELGLRLTLLDIGGGFPGHNGESKFTFEEIAAVVNSALDTHFPAGCGVNIIGEPGRYYVKSALTLAANVIAKKSFVNPLADSEGQPAHMYYINDGNFGSFNFVFFKEKCTPPVALKRVEPEEPLFESSVWGPTCDGLDCVMERTQLLELHVGDWLLFRNMGAYTLTLSSGFNGFPLPNIHYMIGDAEWSLLVKESKDQESMSSLNLKNGN